MHSLAFSPDGRKLATGATNGAVQQYDMATGKPSPTIFKGEPGIDSLAYSPDGSKLAVGTQTAVLIFDARGGGKLAELNHDRARVVALAWSPDGKSLAGGTDARDGQRQGMDVRVWDVASKRLARQITRTSPHIFLGGLSWSPDGKKLALARFEGYDVVGKAALDVWDVPGNRQLLTLRDTAEIEARSPLFSLDGQSVSLVSGRQIKTWSLAAAS